MLLQLSKSLKYPSSCGYIQQSNGKILDVVSSLSHVSKYHGDLYELSLTDPTTFWGEIGRKKLKWMNEFHTVTDSNMSEGKHKWFLGGTLNISGGSY